ncbi:NHLP family bacteriocin export ABC transporter peptidase/permease/ATPase subunit [Ruegeria arenilitoris]|uniref:NHLP family bacteriocin export ABC transporter peptidase/permease/ATPase subunit n=1 Tax=Ruegeria arenilitoris TaxID=1173585 RepID=UPI00147FE2F2|nr:NHLP family bacteriocin export ABC transporter peptidase/permease/ATPase subunit [Ruegeria arenilitoris]
MPAWKNKNPSRLSKRRVRTPTVLQMEAVECGAASLAMVLAYFQRFETLDSLRLVCGVSRDGSNAGNIVHAAKVLGCDAHGFKKPAGDVLSGSFPAILFWNFNHFVVLEGADKTHAFLNDPGIGHRTVTRSDFEKSYSGIALYIEPGEGFKTGGKRPQPIRQLLGLSLNYRLQMMFILLIGLLLVIPGYAVPNFAGIFVDDVLLGQQDSWLRPLIFALVLAAIFQGTLSWVMNATILRIQTHLALKKSAECFWHLLRLPSQFFELRFMGDLVSRVSSIQSLAQTSTEQIGTAAINIFTASILFVLMMMLDQLLALIAISGASLNVMLLRFLRAVRLETSIRLSVEQGKLFSASVNGISNIETLKISGGEDDFFGKWAGYHARAVNTEQRLSRLDQATAMAPQLITTVTVALALWIGGQRVMNSALSLGGFIAFQALFAVLAVSVQRVVDASGLTQQVAAGLIRLNDITDHAVDWRHEERQTDTIDANQTVALKLDGLRFGYNPRDPALIEDFNLEMNEGEWVALVGRSGSGKTTVAKLASGLYQPWSGCIQVNGRPITSFDRTSLSDLIGSVDQKIVLFEGTLRENISLWDPEIPQENLVSAIQDAQLFDVVSARAESFDAPVEEKGRNFSGGERQRIEIARALVRSPKLLILDEATSALDPETELKIMESLRRRKTTCLVVAHRLSTIRDCDQIIVLDKGRVAERGTHAELMALKGEYFELVAEGEM